MGGNYRDNSLHTSQYLSYPVMMHTSTLDAGDQLKYCTLGDMPFKEHVIFLCDTSREGAAIMK